MSHAQNEIYEQTGESSESRRGVRMPGRTGMGLAGGEALVVFGAMAPPEHGDLEAVDEPMLDRPCQRRADALTPDVRLKLAQVLRLGAERRTAKGGFRDTEIGSQESPPSWDGRPLKA